ncbi:MAG TPA: Mth938-like domain-containing protein [Burkholderiales bacterium]|nr:Mth938-like domain-containing protein [Burkholderiales bacterium]
MKLHPISGEGRQLVSGYGAGYVAVNRVRYEKCVLVTPEAVMEWSVSGAGALTEADFAFVATLKPEIVIVGTGAVQRLLRPELARALAATGVGFEVMDSRAACRTYNILAAEGRRVVAAIVVE